VNPPDDSALPFFAYGLFKPGQPAFFQIREYVPEAGCVTARVPGLLLVRDGIPILKNSDSDWTQGVLVTFNAESAHQAYETIATFEPKGTYEWTPAVVGDRRANVLYAADPEAGNPIDWPDWDGWEDPLFKEALQVVEETQQQAQKHDLYHQLFRLQMAYMLLWSAIERYATFRFRATGRTEARISKLATDETGAQIFAELVAQHVPEAVAPNVITVRDHDGRVFRRDPSQPLQCLSFFRHVRHNVTHRGKSVPFRDTVLLADSLAQLVPIFRGVLKAAQAEADSDCCRFLNPQFG
jgi:hypothetical protein